jgi:hypothetical protein
MIVDVHAHGLSEDFIVAAANHPHGWRVDIAGPRRYIAAGYGPLDLLPLLSNRSCLGTAAHRLSSAGD